MKTGPSNGIISYKSGRCKNSAIILQNSVIITTGLVLLQIRELFKDLNDDLRQDACLSGQKLESLEQFDFRTISKHQNHFVEKKVKIGCILYSKNIANTLVKYFQGLKISINGQVESIQDCVDLFSTLLIFQYEHCDYSLPALKHMFSNSFRTNSNKLRILDEIVCVGAPFGNENFINSFNFGHIANVFGENQSLALLNVSSTFGCQGCGVYDKNLNLRFVLLESNFIHHNGNVIFPLAANIEEFYKIIFPSHVLSKPVTPLPVFTNSVCLLESIGSWGSGCLFVMEKKYFILTCAHILNGEHIFCHYKGKNLKTDLIYKNPEYNTAFDIALLSVNSNFRFCDIGQLTHEKPKIGQTSTGERLYNTARACY
ncbi:uncharacterized protein LOC129755908 [Uranotaenia lowii]|uniref:uncharacterized protein LOC129755908 n=1 Tax=Uranotaenia lowii TaxID=190385 RepID=UPI002479F174|nr:uncharacterized protein LOC129755908 [Uranotaenia lowii]